MTRALLWIVSFVLVLAGLAGIAVYAGTLVSTGDRNQAVQDYAAMFAFSVVVILAGSLLGLTLRNRLPGSIYAPDERLTLTLFVVALGLGFAATALDGLVLAAPVLALVAAAALVAFVARLVVRWTADRSIAVQGWVGPGLWGMIGAPLTAGLVQLASVVALVVAGAAGIYLADASLIDTFGDWAAGAAETADLSILSTPSVAFATVGVLGITAPLTEELAKFFGVYLVFRGRSVTKFGLFIAGVAGGIGFAAVETLGYALMAVEQWPQIMLLRAPVALIHVAATTIVALGWYRQRQVGGFAFLLYFVLAVGVHAAWNSLFVSMMILASGLETSDAITPAQGMLTLVVAGAMGAILVGSAAWIIGNARRLGREQRSGSYEIHSVADSATTAHATAY